MPVNRAKFFLLGDMTMLERKTYRQVRLTVNRALAYWNFQASMQNRPQMSINELARRCGVAATTVHRLVRDPENDPKAAAALSLDMASRLVTVLDCRIDEILEVVETEEVIENIDKPS